MSKITRVRTGCWTCKKRHRKCDETKPACNNCISTGRTCEGYSMRLSFSADPWTVSSAGRKKKTKKAPKNDAQPPKATPQKSNLSKREKKSPPKPLVLPTAPAPEAPQKNNGGASHRPASAVREPDHFGFLLSPLPPGAPPDAAVVLPLSQAIGETLTHTEGPRSPLSQMFGEIFSAPLAELENTPDVSLEPDLMKMLGRPSVFDESLAERPSVTSLNMTYAEENMMLKHFFQKLLPLLDAHPKSPWPVLALQYCDFDVARSCFISLACIHIYESREGGNEFYTKGIAHIHSTMNHLIEFISNTTSSARDHVAAADKTKMQLQSFVILVLVNVHILFAVLEKGQSSLSRYLFKVFGSLCQDVHFHQTLMETESKGSLVVVLSWYDTVSAVVSPDCRLPYCNPEWYGSGADIISTSKMMGCPGEIFKALSEVCFLRHEIYNEIRTPEAIYKTDFARVKAQILKFRDYVMFEDGQDYSLRLKAAQCWGLAVYVTLLRLFKTEESARAIKCAVHEFIDSYGSMPSESPLVTQMVWPTYAIGCECKTDFERDKLYAYITTLYESAQMGTLASLRWVVEQVWQQGASQEEVLENWLDAGVDYLPL